MANVFMTNFSPPLKMKMFMIATAIIFFFFFFYMTITAATISDDHETETYIIHMDSMAMPKPFSSHHSWYSSIVSSALQMEEITSPKRKSTTSSSTKSELIIYTYTKSIHGFSAKLTSSQLKSIQKSPAFISSTKDKPLQLATTRSSEFLGLNSKHGAWPSSDFGGLNDVIIGVVDSGIWPESSSFSDEGMSNKKIPQKWKGGCYGGTNFNASMCNSKLIGVRYFNRGFKAHVDPSVFANVTFHDSARDLLGHGTHVASTAAGNYVQGASYFGYASGTLRGIAPHARLAIYKVGFTKYHLYGSDAFAAIDAAIEDGIDILTLSIGYISPLYDDFISIATFSAMENSIFVSNAAGNFGTDLGSVINGAPWLLTVAAGTTDRAFVGTIVLGNGVYITGVTMYPLNPIPAGLQLFYMETCGGGEDLENKIVVCPITDYIGTLLPTVAPLQEARVAGAVLISDVTYFTDLPDDETGFPAIVVNNGSGKILLEYIRESKEHATATLWFKETTHGVKPAPKVADYSSRGPSPTCPFVLKPDVMAPGHNIMASWQEQLPVSPLTTGNLINSFRVESGTSMASPHVAGVAALLKAVHTDWSPAAIKSAIMTTSYVLDNVMSPIKERGSNEIASPLAIGAGHIDPNMALDPGLVYDANVEDYVNLLCGMNFSSRQIRKITRSSKSCLNQSLDLNYPSFIAYFNCSGSKSVVFRRTLTNVVVGNDDVSSYSAKLVGIEGFDVTVVPDKLVFKNKGEKQNYEMKIEGNCLQEGSVVYGWISWMEVEGTHSVTSPVVVTGLHPDLGK